MRRPDLRVGRASRLARREQRAGLEIVFRADEQLGERGVGVVVRGELPARRMTASSMLSGRRSARSAAPLGEGVSGRTGVGFTREVVCGRADVISSRNPSPVWHGRCFAKTHSCAIPSLVFRACSLPLSSLFYWPFARRRRAGLVVKSTVSRRTGPNCTGSFTRRARPGHGRQCS